VSSVSLAGRVIEVGRSTPGEGIERNQIVIEIAAGQLVTLRGVSDTFARNVAKFFNRQATLTIEVSE
jgi:hypothetical protein